MLSSCCIPLNNLRELKGLAPLNRLVFLDLSTQDQFGTGLLLAKLDPLANLINLQTLFLNGNKLEHVDPLANLTNLQTLFLHENNLENLDCLAALDLVTLKIEENKLASVAFVSGMANLRSLTMEKNVVGNIDCLKPLAALETLNTQFNKPLPVEFRIDASGEKEKVQNFLGGI
jgi:internalin A